VAGARQNRAVLTIALGEGSAVYNKPFADGKKFPALLAEAEKKSKRSFSSVGLSGWSAGYGAIRAILRSPASYKVVQWVILLDGMHADYVGKKGDPIEKRVKPADVDIFVTFAKAAVAGTKKMLILHSSIVTGSYASTTETADYTLAKLGLKRQAFKGTGPNGLPQKTEAKKGGFCVIGCAGTMAADHVDQLHALPAVVKILDGK